MDMKSVAYECGDMASDCQRFRDLLEAHRVELCKDLDLDKDGALNQALSLAADALSLSSRLLIASKTFAEKN